MKKIMKFLAIVAGLALLVLSVPAYKFYEAMQRGSSDDPLVWEDAIAALEADTKGTHPPGQAVVFVGSSSIRFWKTLHADMEPIPVVQHGFGGAKLNDVVHYADRLVTNYKPRAVIVFAGTNDITPRASKTPDTLLASYQAFIERVTQHDKQLQVYFIGITPSVMRWEVWPIARQANQLIQQWIDTQDNLHFIDTSVGLLDEKGEVVAEHYVFDGLHLSEKGYSIWARIIRKRLVDDLGLL